MQSQSTQLPWLKRTWGRLFIALALVSVLQLGALSFWRYLQFREGLLAYVNANYAQRVEQGLPRLIENYQRYGNFTFLRFGGDLDQLLGLLPPKPGSLPNAGHRPPPDRPPQDRPPKDRPPQDRPPQDRPPQDRPPQDRPPQDRPPQDRPPQDRPPQDRPLHGGPPEDRPPPDISYEPNKQQPPQPRLPFFSQPLMGAHLSLLDINGKLLIGPPVPPPDRVYRRWQLRADDKLIGELLMASLPKLEGQLDLDFASSQLRDSVIAAVLALLLSLVVAWRYARWLLLPLRALSDGIRALASGAFGQRVKLARVDEFSLLAEDVNHLAIALDDHQQTRQRWSADIAHELRTPVAILHGEIQALQDGVRPVDQRALASLEAETTRLSRLIEDLYQLSLADAGAFNYKFERTELNALVQQSCEAMRMGLQAAGLQLLVVLMPDPVYASVDRARFQQLISNLLENSRKYTRAPGQIQVTLLVRMGVLELTVADSAPGVAPHELPQLFERLYRSRQLSENNDSSCAGLGLAIVRSIAHAHGGEVVAEHSALGGLSVRFTMAAALQ